MPGFLRINADLARPSRWGAGWCAVLFWLVLAAPMIGCRPPKTPYPASLISERPAERVAAIKYAAEIKDQSVINILVDRLEDEDEAVRFFAIIALEKLIGDRQGYDYYASPGERSRAVRRWRRYLAEANTVSQDSNGGAQ